MDDDSPDDPPKLLNPPPTSYYRDLLVEGDLAGLPYTHVAVFFDLLERGPQTPLDISKEIPRSENTLRDACKELYDRDLLERRSDPSEPRGYIYWVGDDYRPSNTR